MIHMRLGNLDLNLLMVFDAVMRERSVVRAADALAISQPAVSHALNRLRHALKDKLFVRTPSGMVPTPRAEELALPVRKALDDLQLAVELLQGPCAGCAAKSAPDNDHTGGGLRERNRWQRQ